MDSYLARIVDRDLPENGLNVRRPGAVRAWLAAYAAATSTDTAYTKILDAATSGVVDKPSRATVDNYASTFGGSSSWTLLRLGCRRSTRSSGSPGHPSITSSIRRFAARLVGVGKAGLLQGVGDRVATSTGSWLGALFESLVAQSVRGSMRVGRIGKRGPPADQGDRPRDRSDRRG